jgi:uncharacterized protein involved in exopolysaccharide biosynthesis
MQPEVVILGALGPGAQSAAEARLAVVNALQEQAQEDIITLSQHGEDVGDLRAQYDALWAKTVGMRAELADLNESAFPDWDGRIDAVHRDTLALVERTVTRRKGAPERKMLMGLGWGAGVAALVAGAAYWVWRRRRRRRAR